jgi:hypothetical protein
MLRRRSNISYYKKSSRNLKNKKTAVKIFSPRTTTAETCQKKSAADKLIGPALN